MSDTTTADATAPNDSAPIVITPAMRMDAVHNAFTLGWKITELKSRIQIAAIRANAALAGSGTTPDTGGAARTPTAQSADPLMLMVRSSDAFLQASVWRATFNQIASLHAHALPDSATAQTLYEPPNRANLPYLYPPKPDYSDVGASSTTVAKIPILKDFQLFDVTRRAINCLTLLHMNKDDSLIPDIIGAHQAWLILDVLSAAQNTGAGGGVTPTDMESTDTPPTPPADRSGKPAPTQADFKNALLAGGRTAEAISDTWDYYRNEAIKTLSERAVKFLDAWDGYARENFYSGGVLQNNEMELIAYEAGDVLAGLSWHVAVATTNIQYNSQLNPAPLPTDETDRKAAQVKLADALKKAWEDVFSDRIIIHVQHQITALSTALDDAYYNIHTDMKRPAEDAILIWPNPDAPSQAIHAVKQSLDYWQRAVLWIGKSETPINWSDRVKDKSGNVDALLVSRRMQTALKEQADIWQSLLTGQQSLRAFSIESVTQKIVQQAMNSIQQTIKDDFGHSASEALTNAGELAKDVSDTAKHSLDQLAHTFRPYLILVGVSAVGVGVLLTALLTSHSGSPGVGAGISGVITTAVTAIMGMFGYHAVNTQKNSSKDVIDSKQAEATQKAQASSSPTAGGSSTSLESKISGLAAQTGAALLKALEDGYKQIRIEFADLSQSVAVTYPLVEFFALSSDVSKVKDDYAFLTQIIWSGPERDAEVQQVARAAFGPFSAMLRLSAPANK